MNRAGKPPVELKRLLVKAFSSYLNDFDMLGPNTQASFERMAAVTERRYRIGEDNRLIKVIGESFAIGMIFVLIILACTAWKLALVFFAGMSGGGIVMAIVNYWGESQPFTMDDLP